MREICDDNIFKVYSLSNTFSESYLITTAFALRPGVWMGEYFFLSKLPVAIDMKGEVVINTNILPYHGIHIDSNIMLEKVKRIADFSCFTLSMRAHAGKTMKMISFVEINEYALLRLWMLYLFRDELKKIYVLTRCEKLIQRLSPICDK